MTQPEIETGNKLIAEFMAYQNQNGVEYRIPQHERMIAFNSLTGAKKSNTHFRSDFFKHDELMFHSSWDWLMPVVEKIYQTGISGGMMDDYQSALASAEIGRVYREVIKFIEWYNQQPKP